MELPLKVNQKERFVKENIMPALKIFGKRIGGPKEEDFKKRITMDDKMAPNFDVPKRASRVDFSEMNSKGPNMGKVNKVTKKEVSVEGNLGSVDRSNPDVIGPNMGQVITAPNDIAPNFAPIKEAIIEKEMDLQDKARRSMGFKKGGKVKAKSMASGGKVSSASKRADGCAMKGKTKGRFV
jgi:hypothetical protein